MLPLRAWIRERDWNDRPWVILGKGPSFTRHRDIDLDAYYLFSLNHVVRERKVDVAHYIDLDALTASADATRANAEWLMMPLHPHVNFAPSPRPLGELLDEVPVLREFGERGRLVCYLHEPAVHAGVAIPVEGEPVVRVHFFSAEAAVNILAHAGVRRVRTLGIDGGVSYGQAFHDLGTLLANGQQSFDGQFIGIYKTVKEYEMDFGPLGQEPVRVFVGTDDSQMVATRVLEYSIRKFSTRPVEVTPLLNLPVPTPKDPANRPRTGFSFARFLIPELAGYRGRGIYLDADMLVFTDIAELWDHPLGSRRVACTRQDAAPPTWRDNSHFQPGRQMSVMLLDCGRLDWKITEIVRGLDEGRFNYKQLLSDLCVVPPDEIADDVPPAWNSLEHYEPGKTCLLHFTDMSMQPWRHNHNPVRGIWRAIYREAVEAGFVPPELVEAGIRDGHLLPELADDLPLAPSRSGKSPQVPTPPDCVGTARRRREDLEMRALHAELGLLRLEREGLLKTLAQTKGEVHRLAANSEKLQTELTQLRESISFRFGLAATSPLRIVRRLLRKTA
jgi:hypothetical protein